MNDIENLLRLLEHIESTRFCVAIERAFNITLPLADLSSTRRDHQQNIVRALSQQSAQTRHEIEQWAERVMLLTDTAGQVAIESIRLLLSSSAQEAFARQSNQFERSVWLCLNQPALFQEALAARFADNHRQNAACYSGFVCARDLTLCTDDTSLAAFRMAVAELVHCDVSSVAVNVFTRRHAAPEDNNRISLHYVRVYHNVPAEAIDSVRYGRLEGINIRRANTLHITYEPDSGHLEVLSIFKAGREKIARLVADILLRAPLCSGRLPLKTYHYQFLAKPVVLDICDEPVTAAVVTKLGFTAANGRSLKIKIGPKDVDSIYKATRELSGSQFSVARHALSYANITIKLMPQAGDIARSTNIILRGENGCNINGKREYDRQLCARLLRKWNIVRVVGEAHVATE